MYKDGPDYDYPSDDTVLWRYMNFAKFVSLLDKRSLFFSRADKLGDPFEGAFHKEGASKKPTLYKDARDVLAGESSIKRVPRFTLVNCWHESEYESAAMWDLYARTSDGIAIITDGKSLRESLYGSEEAQHIYLGRVKYIDYDTHRDEWNDSLIPFMHKRKHFEHEREVRAVIQKFPSNDGVTHDLSEDICEIGEYYEVDISILIDEVVVTPYAQDWFLELTKSIAGRYNLDAPVTGSKLAAVPTWG